LGMEHREEGKKYSSEDVKELHEILEAVSSFLNQLNKIAKDLLFTVYSGDFGERVGESVASFYKKLKESGLPEEMAREMTLRFYNDTMILRNLGGLLSRIIKHPESLKDLEKAVKKVKEELASERSGEEA